jgi:hypothetical protein
LSIRLSIYLFGEIGRTGAGLQYCCRSLTRHDCLQDGWPDEPDRSLKVAASMWTRRTSCGRYRRAFAPALPIESMVGPDRSGLIEQRGLQLISPEGALWIQTDRLDEGIALGIGCLGSRKKKTMRLGRVLGSQSSRGRRPSWEVPSTAPPRNTDTGPSSLTAITVARASSKL